MLIPNGQAKDRLSTTTIIIIAVVGFLGALIFTIVLWRVLVRCFKRRKPAPLPPIQDLAHRREQQVAAFTASRQTQWLDPPESVLHHHASFQSGSSVSLLRNGEKHPSGQMDDGVTAEGSVNSPVTLESDPPLHPPNPMFYPPATSSPHVSMISTDSSYSTLPRPAVSPSPSRQPSEAHSASQVSVDSNSALQPRPMRARTRTPSRNNMRQSSRNRPLSQISSAGTSYSGHHTVRSASTTRGAPHRPFSGVQIVLPAPLGSELAAQQRSSSYGTPSRTSMLVDQWVLAGSRPPSPEDTGRKRRGSSASRRSQRSSSTPPSQQREPKPALPAPAPPPIPVRPASAADHRRSGTSTPPTAFNNSRHLYPHHSRSTSSLRNEVGQQHTQPMPVLPMRTYNSLADLAQSSFEVNEYMRDRGRTYAGIDSPQLTPSSSSQTAPGGQQTPPQQLRPRSQSRSRPPRAEHPSR